jgi:ankyrin repeat protein
MSSYGNPFIHWGVYTIPNLEDAPIYKAAANNDTRKLSVLLEAADAPVNKHSPHSGYTALQIATIKHHKDTVKILLEHKSIDVNIASPHPLLAAIRAGDTSIALLLLSHASIQVNRRPSRTLTVPTPLTEAIQLHQNETVRTLLEHPDIDINVLYECAKPIRMTLTPLQLAICKGNTVAAELLLQRPDIDLSWNTDFQNPLQMAVQYGNAKLVSMLLERKDAFIDSTLNVSPGDNDDAMPLLVCAVKSGRADIVSALLAFKDIDVNATTGDGTTALIYACVHDGLGFSRVAQLLLARDDVDITVENKQGHTALYGAVSTAKLRVIKALLGRDILHINTAVSEQIGETILLHACRSCNDDVIRLLLAQPGIDVNKPDAQLGLTPLMRVIKVGDSDVLRLMLNQPQLDYFVKSKRGLDAEVLAREMLDSDATKQRSQYDPYPRMLGEILMYVERCRMAVIFPSRKRELWPSSNASEGVPLVRSFFQSDLMDIQVLRCVRVYL